MKMYLAAMILIIVPFFSARPAWADHVIEMTGTVDEMLRPCCGQGNCLPANVVKLDENGTVVINDVRIKMHPKAVHPEKTPSGWYCWRFWLDECRPAAGSTTIPPEIITKECAQCAFPEDRAGNF